MNFKSCFGCYFQAATLALGVFTGALFQPGVAIGTTFDLARDFSLAANPNGAWSYGWAPTVGGTFTRITLTQTATVAGGIPIQSWQLAPSRNPAVYHNGGTNTWSPAQGTFPPGATWFHGGDNGQPENFGVIRFTVPVGQAGNYKLQTRVEPHFIPAYAGDTDFHAVKNGTELFGQFLAKDQSTSYSNTLALAEGDAIDFVIGRGADSNQFASGLKIEATLTLNTNSPPPPPQGAFDLSADFSIATNPNGVWSYGHLTELDGTFGALSASRTFSSDNGVEISVWELTTYQLPLVAKVTGGTTAISDGGRFTAPPGTVFFAPGADGASENFGAIRFTVPTGGAGNYHLETAVRSLFDSTRSRDADFHVLRNGEELFSEFLPPNSATGYTNTLSLAVGDTIDFAIGRGADGTTLDTGLKIHATLTLTTNAPPPPPPTGFDLGRDFSVAANPNGAWSYGTVTQIGQAFRHLTVPRTQSVPGGTVELWAWPPLQEPAVYHNPTDQTIVLEGGQAVYPPDAVWFYPGPRGSSNNFGVIRFTVPTGASGNYLVESAVQHYLNGSLAGDTDFHVALNGVELFGRFLPPTERSGYTNTLALQAGDAIDFLVGRGADNELFASGLRIAAVLSLIPNSSECAPAPDGLVAWWPGEGTPNDTVGTNHATLLSGVSYGVGQVEQGFAFSPQSSGARVLASPSLNVGAGPGFTIEGWINPSDLEHLRPIAEWNSGNIGAHFWAGVDTVETGDGERNLYANLVDTSGAYHSLHSGMGLVSTGVWQHVALSYDKASGQAAIYHNGAQVAQANLGSFTPRTTGDFYLGYRPSGPFSGIEWVGGQDEMSLYNRALAANEIQAIAGAGADGKCRSNTPPTNTAPQIVSQPASQTVTAGATASFSVGVSGTAPFNYQWRFNGEVLAGGTGSALMLPNVQASQAGPYTVVVGNAFGSITSAVAMLTVNLAPPAAVVRGPYLQGPTVSSLVVRWRTDLPTDSRVRFGLTANNLTFEATDPGVTTEHSVALNGLAPDTKYFYAVGSGTDIQAGGAGYFFTTPPAGPKPTRIWAIGDAGTASFGSTAPLAVRDAYAEFTAARPTDVWLMLGDNAYFSGTDSEYQAAVFNVYQDFLRTTPVWSTLGNHETYAPGPGGQLAYFDIFTLPQGGQSGGLASGTERYYSFDYGDIHFVCLDSELSDKSATGPMVTWLEQDLAANTKDWLIAFWHSPPYSKGSHDSDFEGNLVQMRQTMVPMLESYGVDLVLSGHSHSYERSFLLNGHYGSSGSLDSSMIKNGGSGRPEETGAYSKSATQGAVYVVSGSAGQTSGGQLNHPAMFASLNRLGSMVIDVETNRMEVKFLRETGEVDDQFTLIKGPASPTMPTIVSEPASQTVPIGGMASFSVGVTGTAPFSYQWRFNGEALAGQTGSTLVLANVETSQAGPYSVVVANVAGTATSSDAILTIAPILPCQPAPAGLVSWWTGDGVGTDLVGTNHATLFNGLSFVPGLVGPAWHFDGVNDYGRAAPSPTLNVGEGAGLTIEGWIKPANVAQLHPLVEWNNGNIGAHFWMSVDTQVTGDGVGNLLANLVDTAGVPHAVRTPKNLVTTGTWQHVALTYDKPSGQAVIYLNGAAVGQANLGTFTPQTSHPLYFGYRPSGAISGIRYSGDMDEISLYNRSLPASEIQALHASGLQGKCKGEIQPTIVSGPASQTVIAGGTASFTVVAGGSTPLEYQWLHGGEPIPEATNSTLTLSNVQIGQAGNYSVIVANSAGSITSADAVLTVNLPPPTVRVVDTIGVPGGGTVVPIQLLAQGNENAVGFSLNFNPALLSFSSAVLGENAPVGATLIVNDQQAGEGRIGLAVALAANATFPPGTQQVVRVTFNVAPVTSATTTPLTFGDLPTVRQVSDAQAQVLGAVFTSGIVSITEADFEGDVASRPNGNRALTITDWVQAGRFVAGLDTISNPGEFQRADSAPRGERGNGVISITDWVQAGRYSVGLDPLTPVGGPMEPVAPAGGGEGGFQPASGRALIILNTSITEGLTNVVLVTLDCSGNENALGFTVNFDTAKLRFVSAEPGAGTGTATLNINATQTDAGRLGVALAQPPGGTLQAGTREVARLQFAAMAGAPATSLITFGDAPIYRETSDSQANSLTTAYAAGTVTITPMGPALHLYRLGNTLLVSWSAAAVGFKLESTTNLEGGVWTEVTGVIPFGDQQLAAISLEGSTKFFRLRKP